MSRYARNDVLKTVRTYLKFTQRELAEEAKINSTYVCQIETGARKIGHRVAYQIWTALRPAFDDLGLTQEDLLRGYREVVW